MSDDEDRPGPSAPDPTERFDDPVEELVDVPEVENPADRLPDPSEVDPQIRRQFWTAVVWLDIALAGVVLGPAYVLLVGGVEIGAAITVVGLLAAFRLYQTYRVFHQSDGTDEDRPRSE